MGTKIAILQMAHVLVNIEMQQRLEDLSHSACFRSKGEIFQKYKHLSLILWPDSKLVMLTCWRSRKLWVPVLYHGAALFKCSAIYYNVANRDDSKGE